MSIVKDHGLNGDFPRDLVQIPTVSIDGNILYFYDVFSTTVPVFVVDASDNVVFSATLKTRRSSPRPSRVPTLYTCAWVLLCIQL